MFRNKQKVIETIGSSDAYRHCIGSVFENFRQNFRRSSMFIGKFIHYANTIASNVSSVLVRRARDAEHLLQLLSTNAYTNIDVTGCCTYIFY